MRPAIVASLLVFLVSACGGGEPPGPAPATGGQTPGTEVRPLDETPGAVAPPPPVAPTGTEILREAAIRMKSIDPEVRAGTLENLLEADDRAAAGELASRLLRDEDEEVRALAVTTVAALGYQAGLPDLRRLLAGDESSYVRKEALLAVHDLAGPDSLPDLTRALREDEDGTVRGVAAALLAKTGSAKAVEPLVEQLGEDFNVEARAAIIVALRDLKARAAVPALIDCLGDRGLAVRAEAARTLGALGDRAAVGPLVTLLEDEEDSQVIVPALRSLNALTGEKVEFSESDPEEQDAAVKTWLDWWEENRAEYEK